MCLMLGAAAVHIHTPPQSTVHISKFHRGPSFSPRRGTFLPEPTNFLFCACTVLDTLCRLDDFTLIIATTVLRPGTHRHPPGPLLLFHQCVKNMFAPTVARLTGIVVMQPLKPASTARAANSFNRRPSATSAPSAVELTMSSTSSNDLLFKNLGG
jgi:hypothetical protein